MTDEIDDAMVEKALDAAFKAERDFYIGDAGMRAALLAVAPAIRERERKECAEIARGSFPFDIETWLNSTKKEMTEHVGNAIADTILAREAG